MTYKWGILGIYWGYTLLTNPVPMSSTSPTPVVGTNELLRIWIPLHGAHRGFSPRRSFCSCFRYFTKKPWHLLLLNYPKVIHSQTFEIEPLTNQFCLDILMKQPFCSRVKTQNPLSRSQAQPSSVNTEKRRVDSSMCLTVNRSP